MSRNLVDLVSVLVPTLPGTYKPRCYANSIKSILRLTTKHNNSNNVVRGENTAVSYISYKIIDS